MEYVPEIDMPPSPSTALPTARAALRIAIVLNWLSGACILVLLVATIVAKDWTLHALGVARDSEIYRLIMPLRAIAALGLFAIPLNDLILRRLLAMVGTVGDGDPFVASNAQRLRAIAWALLSIQLISMAIGGIGKVVSNPAHPLHLDAGFSVSGWLAVLLTFVLARVFAEGTAMREDLAGTV